ncbi:MBL fold metallo-hydrolase [Flagellimonas sp.]|uniref:MBL fold metallo-hydrolase n=1 Tax=Flagellimonas sp. TaxID=2058762 RepID=UPI003BACAF61
MKIRYIKSACVSIESKGVKILTDPWLVDGEYYGAWCHYPKLEFNHAYFDSFDYIYISHIHPDHFSKKTFVLLNKNIPVLIHQYASPFLKMNIEQLGFKVTELAHNTKTVLKNGVSIDILAADNCNPELCAKFMGCGVIETKFKSTQIDSLAVISDGTYNVLNLNDCPFDLAKEAVERVLNQYKSISFLLVGYGGAGPYPQCFELSDEERQKAENSKKLQFLSQGEQYISLVAPNFYMPFAGTYTLAGRLSELQNKRGVPELEEAFIYFENSNLIDQKKSKPVLLNTYEYFDLETQKSSKEYIPVDMVKKERYIKNVLSKRKLDYEYDDEPSLEEILELVPAAFERMESKRKEINFTTETKVLIQLKDDKYIKIGFDGSNYELIHGEMIDEIKSFVEYSLSLKLLYRILRGPKYGHWNNAEIGSHIKFRRVPNIFERGLYHSMCFFHR